jgi:hypothetical protein
VVLSSPAVSLVLIAYFSLTVQRENHLELSYAGVFDMPIFIKRSFLELDYPRKRQSDSVRIRHIRRFEWA